MVHLASASALAALADAEWTWSAARKVERTAAQNLDACTHQCRAAETRSEEAAVTAADRLRGREENARILETRQTSLHDEQDKTVRCEEALMLARQFDKEASEALQGAEAKLKKSKLKARKKQKSKKKKMKLQRAVVEAESGMKLATLELGNAQSKLGDAEVAVRVQTEVVARADRHANLAREKLDKSTAEHAAAEKAVVTALDHATKTERTRAAAAAVLQQAKESSAERKACMEAVERDATFANWPGDPRTQQLPAPFRDYEVNQEMDTFELDVGRDSVVDVFFEGLCGHVWAEAEKVTVAACIGNAFGWKPIGGPCWQRVRERMEELLAKRMEERIQDRE